MDTIQEENIISEKEQEYLPSSSPLLFPQSEMDIFFENKVAFKERKIMEHKIKKVEQARSLIMDILEMENNKPIKTDLLDSISNLDFLIIKIKNPTILSPKETILNQINSKINELSIKESDFNDMNLKIHELSSKIDNIGKNNKNN